MRAPHFAPSPKWASMTSARKPVTMKTSGMPAPMMPCTMCSRIGFPSTHSMGLGSSLVSSRMRVPLPAARMTAFTLSTNRPVEAFQHAVFAEHFHQMIKAGADGRACAGQPSRMHQHAGFDAEFRGQYLHGFANIVSVEAGQIGEHFAHALEARPVLGREIFLHRFGIQRHSFLEIKSGELRKIAEELDLFLAGVERGFDVIQRKGIRVDAGP